MLTPVQKQNLSVLAGVILIVALILGGTFGLTHLGPEGEKTEGLITQHDRQHAAYVAWRDSVKKADSLAAAKK